MTLVQLVFPYQIRQTSTGGLNQASNHFPALLVMATSFTVLVPQATGEATYIDDIPRRSDELYLAFVLSSRAHAKIVKVDASEALKDAGVVDFVSRKDVSSEANRFHTVINNDEILFAEDEVFCVGQIIGAIVADNQVEA